MRIGYHASHEQYRPRELLEYVGLAEAAGFEAAMCSDHVMPWSTRQASSGLSWSWLGAALQATGLSYGTVCAPGERYHPAIVAQGIATLAEMYPGRFWIALASGEHLNEHVTGAPWPPKAQRHERLRECVEVIRALLRGEEVTHRGLVEVDRARLYVLPGEPVPLLGAALTPETAEWCAAWADGLITASSRPEDAARLVERYRGAGGRGPVYLQVVVSWAESEEAAIEEVYDQWRQVVLDPSTLADTATPEEFDAAVAGVSREEVAGAVPTSPDPDAHVRLLREFAETGAEAVYVHSVARHQRAFIDFYAREVLPALKRAGTPR